MVTRVTELALNIPRLSSHLFDLERLLRAQAKNENENQSFASIVRLIQIAIAWALSDLHQSSAIYTSSV